MAHPFEAFIFSLKCLSILVLQLLIMARASLPPQENFLVDSEMKDKILNQFDLIDESISMSIDMLHEDNNDIVSTSPLPDENSNTQIFSHSSVQYMKVFDNFQHSSVLQTNSESNPSCSVTINKLTNLKNEINDVLSNITTKSSNCQYDYSISKNCKEIIKLIQCGISHIKSGFINGLNNNSTKNEALKWKNAFDNLSQRYRTELDNLENSLSSKYKFLLEGLKIKLQNLQVSFEKLMGDLKATKKNCIPIDFCPFESWSVFKYDISRFLKVCQFVRDVIFDIHEGKIKDAVEKWEKIDDLISCDGLQEILRIIYLHEGDKNYSSVLKFVRGIPRKYKEVSMEEMINIQLRQKVATKACERIIQLTLMFFLDGLVGQFDNSLECHKPLPTQVLKEMLMQCEKLL